MYIIIVSTIKREEQRAGEGVYTPRGEGGVRTEQTRDLEIPALKTGDVKQPVASQGLPAATRS